jgi:hypothetical protein
MKQNNRKQVKLIVKERFSGTKPPQDILSDIIISEIAEKQRKYWTSPGENGKINVPTGSGSCLNERSRHDA